MWYIMYENDQKHYVEEGRGRFIRVMDHMEKETLRVTFTPTMNNNLSMTTKHALTYIYNGKTCSAQNGTCYSFPLNREVVLISASAETPRITVRVVKLDDPKDWPAPPPMDRAPTPPSDAAGAAAVDPAPPPALQRKKCKKPRREFHMCA